MIYEKRIKKIGKDDRLIYQATFEKYGTKKGYEGRILTTLLFIDIKQGEKYICDHLWFTMGKQFEKLELNTGDIIEFKARVSKYTKGYFGYKEDVYVPFSLDYKLSYPTQIKVLKRKENKEEE